MAEILRGIAALRAIAAKKAALAASAELLASADADELKLSRRKGDAMARETLRAAKREFAAKLKADRATSTAATGSQMGIINLNAFEAAMDKFAGANIEWSRRFYVDYLEDLFATIVRRTPVKTGRARANWKVGREGATDVGVPMKADGRYPDPIKPAITTIRRIRSAKVEMHIFNNVAYILNLDTGSSRQAPEGIVDPALAEVSGRLGGYIDALDKAVSFEDLDDNIRGSI